MFQLEFSNPKILFMLIGLLPIIAWYLWKDKEKIATVQVSSIQNFSSASGSFKGILRHVLFAFKIMAMGLLILALARPQSTDRWEDEDTFGIDIMLALDVSSSMLARDFKPDRLEASKDIAIEFVAGRRNDRMGLVIFSGESFTQCPLTTDHAVLMNLFREVKSGIIEDGTAIGIGLANSVKRLKDSEAVSKVIILLTDGENNAGAIDPITAAELAKTFGIRVYTIGVGKIGEAPYPVGRRRDGSLMFQKVPVKIDEATLKQIADITDGQYYRATNNKKLKEIYAQIDELEKSKVSVKQFSKKEEEFMPYVWAAIALLMISFIIKKTVLRSIP